MREAIGGAIILKVVLLLIIVFNSYLALSVNYSKAFKVKNRIISLIEQYEGHDRASNEINNYLDSMKYNVTNSKCPSGYNTGMYGYCYKQMNVAGKGYYYKVSTFINIDLPILNLVFSTPFRIDGETKMIYREI